MNELQAALMLAEKLLDEPNCDPDDELRMLSRQLLRHQEKVERLEKHLGMNELGGLIGANRDAILQKHEEAFMLIQNRIKALGDLPNNADIRMALMYIVKVQKAMALFHPMHGESWKGWPI